MAAAIRTTRPIRSAVKRSPFIRRSPTGALCGDPADSVEQTYLGLLPQAANFEISGNQLILRNGGGQEILRYTRIG